MIVASNENLQDAYHKGKFREDLYHRFNEFSIQLPPLRNRKEDIPLIASFFLNKTKTELGKEVDDFDKATIQMFVNYSWPGNLREFRNVVRRSVLLTNAGNKIHPDTLPWEIKNAVAVLEGNDQSPAPVTKKEISGLKDTASKAEYETIMSVLKEVNFNKTKAAELLKIDRKTLYNKISTYEDSQSKST